MKKPVLAVLVIFLAIVHCDLVDDSDEKKEERVRQQEMLFPLLAGLPGTPCVGTYLVPASNVTIQQGQTLGPFATRDKRLYDCFFVTTTGPATITVTTEGTAKAEILFLDLPQFNSTFVDNPSATMTSAVTGTRVQVGYVTLVSFTIAVN